MRVEGLKAEAEGAHVARARSPSARCHARKRKEVETFARDLRRRTEEAEAQAAEAIREAVASVSRRRRRRRRSPRACAARPLRAIRDARDEVLSDPELAIPQEREEPCRPSWPWARASG